MVNGQAALTVADLCDNDTTDSDHARDIDDHSTIGFVEDDDDSFLANSSLCKQHRSTIQMLNSLRREVVEMVRSDDKYMTPKKSPQDVTIDLSKSTELSSPLASPLLSRTLVSMSNKNAFVPVLSNHRITPNTSDIHPHHCINSDDSTFCSMDYSINNEMNILKEVAKDLERELKTENLNTVFEAIERIGKSNDPMTNSLLESEDKDSIREIIRTELLNKEQSHKHTVFGRQLLNIIDFLSCIEISSIDIKILIASIVLYLIRKYIIAWQE